MHGSTLASLLVFFFFFQAEDGIRDYKVTGVQTCALPILLALQASYTFRNTVPLYFVGTLVGKTMMLELGPVLAGLALAGRGGGGMAAGAGAMEGTEQVGALETPAVQPQSLFLLPPAGSGEHTSSIPSP